MEMFLKYNFRKKVCESLNFGKLFDLIFLPRSAGCVFERDNRK